MKKFLQIIFFLILTSWMTTAAADAATLNFLVITDFHFDPYAACRSEIHKPCPLIEQLNQAPASDWRHILASYDTTVQKTKEDANYPLINSSLQAAKNAAQKQDAQFILVLGDMVSHNFNYDYKKYSNDKTRSGYESFVSKTYKFLSSEIAEAFPKQDVYMAVGNNDSYNRDYYTLPKGLFFTQMADEWSQLIKTKANRTDMQKDFKNAGYYAVDVPNHPGLRLIVLNSVLFSNKGVGVNISQAADAQFTWLHQELESAKQKKQRVIIATHIPPTIDVFTSLRVTPIRVAELWIPSYTARFQVELNLYAPEIAAFFVGHLHTNWIQSMRFDSLVNVPSIGVVSVSPVHGNQPGFRVFKFSDHTYELKDFVTYSFPLNKNGTWNESRNIVRSPKSLLPSGEKVATRRS